MYIMGHDIANDNQCHELGIVPVELDRPGQDTKAIISSEHPREDYTPKSTRNALPNAAQ